MPYTKKKELNKENRERIFSEKKKQKEILHKNRKTIQIEKMVRRVLVTGVNDQKGKVWADL